MQRSLTPKQRHTKDLCTVLKLTDVLSACSRQSLGGQHLGAVLPLLVLPQLLLQEAPASALVSVLLPALRSLAC